MTKVYEDGAPTNSAGGGGVAGIGVSPNAEPGVSPRHQPKKNRSVPNPIIADMLRRRTLAEETFAGAAVFEVSSHVFHTAKMEKRKHKTWRKYLEEDDCLSEIREFANKNPGKPIVLRNANTGEMTYARYGKRR